MRQWSLEDISHTSHLRFSPALATRTLLGPGDSFFDTLWAFIGDSTNADKFSWGGRLEGFGLEGACAKAFASLLGELCTFAFAEPADERCGITN